MNGPLKKLGGLIKIIGIAKQVETAVKTPDATPSKKFRMNALGIISAVAITIGGKYFGLDDMTVASIIGMVQGAVYGYTREQGKIDQIKEANRAESMDVIQGAIQQMLDEQETAEPVAQ